MKKVLLSILVICIILGAYGIISGTEADEKETSQEQKQVEESKKPGENITDLIVEAEPEPEEITKSVATTETPTQSPATEPERKETTGQKNALNSAKSYLSFMAFSYQGLIKQLEFEKYSSEEAVYGADNCGADWNEQALKSAKHYIDFSAFSHQGLIKQLEFEKFTNEQAKYGADNCGADWNEQAVKSAQNYLEFMRRDKNGHTNS